MLVIKGSTNVVWVSPGAGDREALLLYGNSGLAESLVRDASIEHKLGAYIIHALGVMASGDAVPVNRAVSTIRANYRANQRDERTVHNPTATLVGNRRFLLLDTKIVEAGQPGLVIRPNVLSHSKRLGIPCTERSVRWMWNGLRNILIAKDTKNWASHTIAERYVEIIMHTPELRALFVEDVESKEDPKARTKVFLESLGKMCGVSDKLMEKLVI